MANPVPVQQDGRKPINRTFLERALGIRSSDTEPLLHLVVSEEEHNRERTRKIGLQDAMGKLRTIQMTLTIVRKNNLLPQRVQEIKTFLNEVRGKNDERIKSIPLQIQAAYNQREMLPQTNITGNLVTDYTRRLTMVTNFLDASLQEQDLDHIARHLENARDTLQVIIATELEIENRERTIFQRQ